MKSKKTTHAPVGTTLDRAAIVAQVEDAMRETEFDQAKPNTLHPDILLLTRWLGWNTARVIIEHRRVQRVVRLQREFGGTAAHAEARDLAKRTADTLATRGPELRAQIKALTSELESIQAAAREAAFALRTRDRARAALRDHDLFPVLIREDRARLVREADAIHSGDRGIGCLQHRLSSLRILADASPSSTYAREYTASLPESHPAHRRGLSGVNEPAWAAAQEEMRAEIETLERELSPLEAEHAAAIARVDALADCLIDEIDGEVQP